MARYDFQTRWMIKAPVEDVWRALFEVERWPSWWKGVESVVELDRGDGDRVGACFRQTWKSRLPYRLEFDMRVTRVERPVALDGVSNGELAGEGSWRLYPGSEGTLVLYRWKVATTSVWMNMLAPVARPLFAWNHDFVMRQGGKGLARMLSRDRRC